MRAIRERRTLVVIAAVCLVTGLLGGAALATIPSSGGVISTCYSKSNGTWRPIDKEAGAKCKSGETQVDLYSRAKVDSLLATYQPAVTHHTLTVYENQSTLSCAPNDCLTPPSSGENFVWRGDGFDNVGMNGTPIARTSGSCQILPPGVDDGQCSFTARLAGGQMTASGPFLGTDECIACSGEVAVVGGTGDYLGASGRMVSSCDFSNSPFECTYEFDYSTP